VPILGGVREGSRPNLTPEALGSCRRQRWRSTPISSLVWPSSVGSSPCGISAGINDRTLTALVSFRPISDERPTLPIIQLVSAKAPAAWRVWRRYVALSLLTARPNGDNRAKQQISAALKSFGEAGLAWRYSPRSAAPSWRVSSLATERRAGMPHAVQRGSIKNSRLGVENQILSGARHRLSSL
jgi:hypothetical protein